MAKFSQALYSKNEVREFVDVEQIPHQSNYDEFISHLFCPDDRCNARLSYVRTRKGGHLRKPRGSEHNEECSYAEEVIKEASQTIFIEQNGNLSNGGVTRRNKNMSSKLKDFLDPIEKKKDNGKKPKVKIKLADSDSSSETVGIRIKYDPDSTDDKNSLAGENITVREPSFIPVFLHQISERDANKNLSTVGMIESVDLNKKEELADIHVTFENVTAIFHLPQAFFNNSARGLFKEQLFDYVEMLASYVTNNKHSLYINTMCQTHFVDVDNIVLYIYDPDFPSFNLVSNVSREFRNFSVLAAMISTRAI